MTAGNAVISGERIFCQNAGSSGSMYIVELLKTNGIGPSYHELMPDLDEEGIAYYEGAVPDDQMKAVLRQTRQRVYFEANNRLFAMSKLLKEVFPEARFIHLHRDPRDLMASALSKPPELTYGSGRRRYESVKLNGPKQLPLLQKMCRYWANYNRRILDDLEGMDTLSLSFTDLISGNIDALEDFLETRLPIRKIPPVNAEKPVRKEGRYPAFENWPEEDQQTLLQICGPVMSNLGYEWDREK